MRSPKKQRGDATLFIRGVDRRNFLARLGATSATTAVAVRALSARTEFAEVGGKSADLMLEQLNHALFASHIGTRFNVRIADEVTPFELIEVRQHPVESNRPGTLARREAFSVIFRAPLGTAAPQKIYEMEHAMLGKLGIFLVPLGSDARGAFYEAVFN